MGVKQALTADRRPSAKAIRAHLKEILGSRTFANVREQRLGPLLAYLMALKLKGAPAEAFSGNALAVDFFFKGNAARIARYDSKTDRIVAVNISHLKDRLRRYYLTEGTDAGFEIGFGVGYEPVFIPAARRAAAPLSAAARRRILAALTALDLHTWKGDLRALRYVGEAIDAGHPTWMATAVLVFVGVMPRFPGLAPHGLDALERFGLPAAGTPARWEAVFGQACLRAVKHHDWRDAERRFELAYEASGGASIYYWWHTAVLAARGKFDRAIHLMTQAVEHFARANVGMRCDLAVLQMMAGRFDDAAGTLIGALELASHDDSAVAAHFALLHEAVDDLLSARAYMDAYLAKAFQMEANPGDVDFKPDVHHLSFAVAGFIAGRTGSSALANAVLEGIRVERSAGRIAFGASHLALVCTGLNRTADAVAWLRVAAFDERDPLSMWLHLWPPFRHLREAAEFRALLAELKLPKRLTPR